jgi:hypothetical protein
MQAFAARRGVFAAAILTITFIAATPGRAAAEAGVPDGGTEEAGVSDDGGIAADGAAEASSTSDATAQPPVDATTTGDDGGGSTTFPGPVQDDGALPTYTGPDIFQALCLDDPGKTDPLAKPFRFDQVQAPYTTMDACVAYDSGSGHPAVHSCFCNNCFALVQQCDALPGCKEVLKCGLDNYTACADPSTCYFTACTSIIDKWANTSLATYLTRILQTCGTDHQCPTH